MKASRLIFDAVIAALILTLLSGLVNSTPQPLVGASWYGWPMTWVTKIIVPPGYSPWLVKFGGLAEDLVFWFILSLLVFYIAMKTAKAPTQSAPQMKHASTQKPAPKKKASTSKKRKR